MEVIINNPIGLITKILLIVTLLSSCSLKNDQEKHDLYQNEVRQIELEFATMANQKGISTAFEYYAADDVVLNRGNQLIKGKEALKRYFENPDWQKIKLDWSPDFVDVSSSGDLAYTYGKYTLTQVDSLGNEIKSNGVFHTVWKKQKDDQWKFVWD